MRTGVASRDHEALFPNGTYAPWSRDEDFLRAYQTVRPHTLVDKYRCWELWNLVAQTSRLSGDCIEIGVWRGGTGCLLAKRTESVGMKCNVVLCDTFSGVVKAGPNDDAYKGGEHADTSEALVRDLAGRMGVRIQLLKGMFPEETGSHIAHREFRFCHIDVDVYQSARDCTAWIWPRLVSGGIIVFDDYGFRGCDGVRKFVEEWTVSRPVTFLYNLNGHAIFVKP